MDADLLARPTSEGNTDLILEGTYHPPFGILGLIGDLLFGRLVARSTAEEFVAGLARALEEAVRSESCCARPSDHAVGGGAEEPPEQGAHAKAVDVDPQHLGRAGGLPGRDDRGRRSGI